MSFNQLHPSKPPSGKTVLVVEDKLRTLVQAKTLLEGEGHTVLEAQDLREALGHVNKAKRAGTPIHLIVTDIDYPGRGSGHGGEQLMRLLRASELHQDTPLLAMSRYDGDDLLALVKDMNARFLSKPFNPNDFKLLVNSLLEK